MSLVLLALASAANAAAAEPPAVGEEAPVLVGADEALVMARVDPGGLVSTYAVQFVAQAQFEASGWSGATQNPDPAAEMPDASEQVPVDAELTGLQPNTEYRYRFVASNPLGDAIGNEQTLRSAPEPTPTLPDHRAYELVSTPGSGEPYYPAEPVGSESTFAPAFHARAAFRASEDAIAYVGEPGGGDQGDGHVGNEKGNEWIAHRTTSGWSTEDVTPASAAREPYYEWFSTGLESGILVDPEPLEAGVPSRCEMLYERDDATGGLNSLANQSKLPQECGLPLFAGAADAGRDVLFQSEAALTSESEEATEAALPPGRGGHVFTGTGCTFGCNLYESVAGLLHSVNVLNGKPVPGAVFGGYAEGSTEAPGFSNAISTSGNDVFWTDTNTDTIYDRDSGTGTVQVSGSEPAEFWTATPDGQDAFYTEGGALWQFNTNTDTRKRLVAGGAEVQGVVGTNQTGEDGGYVYFVANGVLTSAPNSENESATVGNCEAAHSENTTCNLYLLRGSETEAPSVAFIASLSGKDDELYASTVGDSKAGGDWRPDPGERVAQATADGETLVFESLRALTGYSGVAPEVFVYDAADRQLACASCSPTGAAVEDFTESQIEELGGASYHLSRLPVSTPSATYMNNLVSESGARVFFDSSQSLTSQDKSGVQQVYEWERPASASEPNNTCTAQRVSAVTQGCTFLISSGYGTIDAFLVGADPEGNNVFFDASGPLGLVSAPAGHTELYDARVDGGFPAVATGCTASSCTPAPATTGMSASPASEFQGAAGGNFSPSKTSAALKKKPSKAESLAKALKTCRREHKRKKRTGCEHAARQKYGSRTTRTKSKGKDGGERRTSR